MIEQILIDILQQDNVRSLLSDLRKAIKEEPAQKEQCAQPQMVERLLALLSHEDAKTRKNAALLLGDLAQEVAAKDEVVQALWNAYQQETTKFVLASYVHGMAAYDCSGLAEQLEQELSKLQSQEMAQEDVKHIRELRKELESIMASLKKNPQVAFRGIQKKHVILLTAEPYIRETLLQQLENYRGLQAKETAKGVRITTDNVAFLDEIRTYREALFLLRTKAGTVLDKEHLAQGIAGSECLPLLKEAYGEQNKYAFRLSFVGEVEKLFSVKERKQLASQIEEATHFQMRNSTDDYVIDIKIHGKKDQTFLLFGKLSKWEDQRFVYRKQVLPTSMAPVTAAQMMALVRPYLQEGAHVLDPFCGVGTLLVERCRQGQVRDVYGVDTFGEAIAYAKENMALAGESFYFINRNYFDFTSKYQMEEIITEFPRMEHKDKKEVDAFYHSFFEKSKEISAPEGMMFLLSTEEACMKKQLRLHKEFALVRTIPMRGQEQIYILKKRG